MTMMKLRKIKIYLLGVFILHYKTELIKRKLKVQEKIMSCEQALSLDQ